MLAAVDSCFDLIGPHQHGTAFEIIFPYRSLKEVLTVRLLFTTTIPKRFHPFKKGCSNNRSKFLYLVSLQLPRYKLEIRNRSLTKNLKPETIFCLLAVLLDPATVYG